VRHGVFLALVLALVAAVPAAAVSEEETVTLRLGETKRLQSIFDKEKKVTLVVSGVITREFGGGLTQSYDPFHGYTGNCQNAGAGVYLQIEDAHGKGIDYNGAGRPPCRSDHRYEFTINDSPPAWDLDGKATASITLRASEGVTTSGSFTLRVIGASKRRDLVFKVLAKKELQASKADLFLADVKLGGAGRIVDLDSGDPVTEARGVLSLTFEWTNRDDTHLTLRPNQGSYRAGKRRAFVSMRVLSSSEPKCPKGTFFQMVLDQNPMRAHVEPVSARECGRIVGKLLSWKEPASEIAVKLSVVGAG
jgi:hypothetical protein